MILHDVIRPVVQCDRTPQKMLIQIIVDGKLEEVILIDAGSNFRIKQWLVDDEVLDANIQP